MKVFYNTNANLKADCTVAVYAQAAERNALLGEHWVEVDSDVPAEFESLYVQAGVRFFGRI